MISFRNKIRPKKLDGRFLDLLDKELVTGFPNPHRVGCPDSEIVQRLARHQLPIAEIDPWIDHLGSCSDCFRDFSRLKLAFKLRRRRIILYGIAACIVLVSAGVIWKQVRERETIARASGKRLISPTVSPGGRSAPKTPENGIAGQKPFEVAVNLTRSATRGEKSANDGAIIRLPARLVRCRMELPLGSYDGLYDVGVQGARESKVLRTTQAQATIKNGEVRLDLDLDLSNIWAGNYWLSYRHAGASWHRVPIVVTNPAN